MFAAFFFSFSHGCQFSKQTDEASQIFGDFGSLAVRCGRLQKTVFFHAFLSRSDVCFQAAACLH